MSRTSDLELVRWLARKALPYLSQPHTWHLNGPLGHFHASNLCEKYKATERAVVRHETFAEADRRTVCHLCIERLFTGNFELLNGARALQQCLVEVAAHQERVLQADPEDMLARQTSRVYVEAQLAVLAERVFVDELGPVHDELKAAASVFLDSVAIDHEQLDRNIRLRCAAAVFSATMRNDTENPLWRASPTVAALGMHRNGYRSDSQVDQLFEQFCSTLADSSNLDTIAGSVPLDSLLKSPATLDQLAVCPSGVPTPGSNLLDHAVTVWRDIASRTAAELLSAWVDSIRAECSSEEWFLVPLRGTSRAQVGASAMGYDSVDNVTLASQRWFSRDNRSAVLCPAPVARWISHGRGGYRYTFSPPVPTEQTVPAEVVDTALALWDPYDRGSYQNFEDAFAAAKLL